jgi:signal transduction histidine kinase
VDGDLPLVNADPDRFCRAIDLALSAAIKSSHGATLNVAAQGNNGQLEIVIENTALQPGRDDPPAEALHTGADSKLTGAGLRLAIVRHLAAQMSGDLTLRQVNGRTTVVLEVPIYRGD